MFKTEFTGLDGGNLLAYLAALGTLRVLTFADPQTDVRLEWVDRGAWTPVLHHPAAGSAEEILKLLEPLVCGEGTIDPGWEIGNDLTLPCEEFGKVLGDAVKNGGVWKRSTLDFLAAFGAEVYGTGPKKGSDVRYRISHDERCERSALPGVMKELASGTTPEHLRRTLFATWDYGDERPSLRWDPADYRPHALRAVDPSGDPIRTMRGANRLAIEALPLFPTAPMGRRVRTTAFREGESGTEIRWPIWTDPLELSSIASLLASRNPELRPGVAQVFRAVRFTEGKYRNFSPSKAML